MSPIESMKRWFKSSAPAAVNEAAAAALPERLKVLEREAEMARLGFRGTPLNRAGDLCMQAKDADQALRYYGRAIDAYLHDGHPELARGVAQKLIRVYPNAVRTYCTLTWLDLGLGYLADARTHVGGYVAAARRAGREPQAIPAVKEMAATVDDAGFREAAATALEDLGDRAAADQIRGGLPKRDTAALSEEHSERCFEAARTTGKKHREAN
jgi:tetratricopeptide (TPR) repeat protein